MIERSASDLHITTGTFPQVRVHGKLTPLSQFEQLTPQDTQRLAYSILNEAQKQKFLRGILAGEVTLDERADLGRPRALQQRP